MMANFGGRPEDSGRTRDPRVAGNTGASADRRRPTHDPANGSA
jgi:hypothetical protein